MKNLFIGYKKDTLSNLRVFDFMKPLINLISRCSEALSNVTPRFDEYINKMSIIESRTGDWVSAIEYALRYEPLLASRVILDKLVLEILQCMYPNIGNPSRRFYELLREEIEMLRNIIEKNEGTENHTVEDIGQINTKKAKYISLDRWVKEM